MRTLSQYELRQYAREVMEENGLPRYEVIDGLYALYNEYTYQPFDEILTEIRDLIVNHANAKKENL